ncbi:hypothetical protein Gpo141_00012016 [Globisporangium polare]
MPTSKQKELQLALQIKEGFLQRVLDPQVVFGDLTGVDAVITQWRRHTAAYATFEIEIDGPVDTAAGSDDHPIVVIYTTLRARFSRERLAAMFPLAVRHREDLVDRLVDRELQFQCVSRFQFSAEGQIVTYMLDVSFVETFMKVLGSASDAAELPHLT